MKVNFETILTKKSIDYISEPGSGEKDIYEYRSVDGKKELVKTDRKTSVYDLIQSHKDETDLNIIIARFLNGDTEIVNRAPGLYADFTLMPKTYAELYARIQECENIFNKLPVKVRDEFDNSSAKFWNMFGSEEFEKVFKKFVSEDKPIEKEVVENAEK